MCYNVEKCRIGEYDMGENTQNGLININLQPVADVTNNIINKLTGAVCWLVTTPHGTRKQMQEAIEVYIEEIRNDDSLPSIVKAAKIRNAQKEILEYCNTQDIILHAEMFGADYECNDEPLDEDWAMFFFDKAKNVSRDDAKVLWGKILAEECRNPGIIPKSLVHILSVMSSEEARAFETLCGFAPDVLENFGQIVRADPLISGNITDTVLSDNGLTYEVFQDLEALGLLHYNVVDIRTVYEQDVSKMTAAYLYHGTIIKITNFPKEFPRGCVLLTNAGRILASLIERKRIEGFEEYLKKYYENIGCTVVIQSI